MKGRFSIFQSIVDPPEISEAVEPRRVKGRNSELLGRRNELLIHRYYYHVKIKKRQYEQTLTILEQDEIFLRQSTIIDIIVADDDILPALRKRNPRLSYFREKYPMWKW